MSRDLLCVAEDERDSCHDRLDGCYIRGLAGSPRIMTLPYLLKEPLLRLFGKYHDLYFLTYTNGTLLDEPTVQALARLGNVAPAISVEGYTEHTDRRRGAGVFQQVQRALALLKRYGVLFGISVTYTRDEFVQFYIEAGALFAWYFMFIPVGKDPILELVPTPEQRVECRQKVARLRQRHPLFMADFWNDGPTAGGCLEAARSYVHIVNSGKVEPCVFAHFGVENIREKSILQAANSPSFKAIRQRFPYNPEGNLRLPCMIIETPEVLREVVDEYLVSQGHTHSEDIIHDPQVVAWIDRYAREFKALADPLWEVQISDPEDRWYREGGSTRTCSASKKTKGSSRKRSRAKASRGAIADKK